MRRHSTLTVLSDRVRADLALAFCALIWGSTFVLVKDALDDVSVLAYIAVRFGLATVIMGLLFWRALRSLQGATVWAGAQIGFFMLGGYLFQTAGLRSTTPSRAAFITGSSVVLVPLILAILGRRRIDIWIWAGGMLALAGLYCLTVPAEGFGALNRGDLLVFVCSLMFALHIIFIGRHIERHSVATLAFLQVSTTAIGSAFLIPVFSGLHWERPRLTWTLTLILAIVVTSLGSTVVGFSLQVWAQQHTSPSHTALLVSLEPVFAALTSWILAAERLTTRMLIGGALIFLAIVLVEFKGSASGMTHAPEALL